MTTKTTVIVVAKAKAFSNEGVRSHKFLVDLTDNNVAVWDSVAGHYTNCNCLGDSAKKRIIKLAQDKLATTINRYTINTECGPMDIEAASVEAAKHIYSQKHGFDFDSVGDFDGSWYYVADEDGQWIESEGTENMA